MEVLPYLQGSWQIPLHMTGPSREDPTFHGASLKGTPRVPCSSLLIRILSMAAARAALRRKTPAYADRSASSFIADGLAHINTRQRNVCTSVHWYVARTSLTDQEATRKATSAWHQPEQLRATKLLSVPIGQPAALLINLLTLKAAACLS